MRPIPLPAGREESLLIRDFYIRQKLTISFEFFPPKTEKDEEELLRQTVPALKRLGPSFISVTYGAGGSTRVNTLRIVDRIRKEHGIEAAHHLTCVGSTKEMLAEVLEQTRALGIENLLALRGDPPRGQTEFRPVEGGFAYALDLIRFIKQRDGFCVGAACYPEGHIECRNKYLDWDYAAAKVEAGAEFLISQLFYDWNDFLEMEDYLRNKRGVKAPIVPGILPFLKTEQIKRFTKLCGAKLPPPLLAQLEKLADDDEAVRQLGVEVATAICAKALAHGVAGLHFYCLNRVLSCREIIHNLGLAPEQ
jgi:methylenetetrahydrofolate reductase (NADPH)